MTVRSAVQSAFVLRRTYPFPPARVFAVWATPEEKARWMLCDDAWAQGRYELDFRVGGREKNRSGPKEGPVHAYEAVFHDIVPNERIVFSYRLSIGEALISVSMTTIEFKPDGAGTRLTLTEHGVFLDGYDGAAEREEGTAEGLDRLPTLLET